MTQRGFGGIIIVMINLILRRNIMTNFVIEKATVSQAKAKIAIVGPAGE